jgi:hypothetical protein
MDVAKMDVRGMQEMVFQEIEQKSYNERPGCYLYHVNT